MFKHGRESSLAPQDMGSSDRELLSLLNERESTYEFLQDGLSDPRDQLCKEDKSEDDEGEVAHLGGGCMSTEVSRQARVKDRECR